MRQLAGRKHPQPGDEVADLLAQPDRTEFRLCGIVSNIAKRLSKKDNRPWASFTLATKELVDEKSTTDFFNGYKKKFGVKDTLFGLGDDSATSVAVAVR